ncbi:MAG: DUF1097 family protein [Clostridia bacterium]
MKTIKYLGGPTIIAILACICQIIDQIIGAPLGVALGVDIASGGWMAFIGWACYFLAGCDIKGGAKVMISAIIAIIASTAIIFSGVNILAGLGFWAFPISILFWVIPTIATEKITMNIVPVLFITAGIFFSMPNPDYTAISSYVSLGAYELVYVFLGCVLGYFTILIRGAYDAKYNSAE